MRHTHGDTRGTPAPRGRGTHSFQDMLVRLEEMKGYQVAAGEPDVRGWQVRTVDGRTAGRVDGLIIDTDAMQVRYLDVSLDRATLQLKGERHVLIGLANARLDDRNEEVRLDAMTAAELHSLQPYEPGRPIAPGPAPGIAPPKHHALPGGDQGPSGGSASARAGALAEGDGPRARTAAAGSGEIRIPLTGNDEVVIEKRTVPVDEVVIRRKRAENGGDEPAVRNDGPTGPERPH